MNYNIEYTYHIIIYQLIARNYFVILRDSSLGCLMCCPCGEQTHNEFSVSASFCWVYLTDYLLPASSLIRTCHVWLGAGRPQGHGQAKSDLD